MCHNPQSPCLILVINHYYKIITLSLIYDYNFGFPFTHTKPLPTHDQIFTHEMVNIHLLPHGPIPISHVYNMLVICDSYMSHL